MARPKRTGPREASPDYGLTTKEVETKMLRACKTLRAIPDPTKKFQWIGCTWPEMVQSAADAYGYNDELMPRFRPSPKDVSEYLDVLAWARPVVWREFRFVWWRSFDLSFGQMAARIHRSDETARRCYTDAIVGIWNEAHLSAPPSRGADRVFRRA